MPTYDYHCDACGHEAEVAQKITEDKLRVCPVCQKETYRRLIGKGTHFQFKGSGFYSTDYKDGGTSSSSTPPSSKKCGCGNKDHCP